MANIAFTFMSAEYGMISASFTLEDTDMKRIYEAYKYNANGAHEQDPIENDDGTFTPAPKVELTPKIIFNDISTELITNVLRTAQNIERNKVFTELNIPPINVKERN